MTGPTMIPALLYKNAAAAVAQLKDAFGFAEHARYDAEDGSVLHAELTYGRGMVMLGSASGEGAFGRAMAGGGPAAVYVVVDDPDAHCERARTAGAEILTPPTDQDYGARDYLARDREGNLWSFGTYRPELQD